MITRSTRHGRNARAIVARAPRIAEDTSFEVTDFENPTAEDQTRIRIRCDQAVVLRATPEDIRIISAGDDTQWVACLAAASAADHEIDLFFPGAFPDTSQIASSDLLDVPFYTDDVRTNSGGFLDASRRTMEPA